MSKVTHEVWYSSYTAYTINATIMTQMGLKNPDSLYYKTNSVKTRSWLTYYLWKNITLSKLWREARKMFPLLLHIEMINVLPFLREQFILAVMYFKFLM